MVDLRRSVAFSSDSSSSSSPSFSAVDPMMETIELEAAEVLADLAHSAMRENNTTTAAVSSSSKWGRKKKRVNKRVKSESPPVDSVSNPVVVQHSSPDPAPEQAVVDQQHGEPMCGTEMINLLKGELDVDLTKESPRFVRRYPPYGGGRIKQNLTEAEQEARKLRRILANRESARQTIRRRQALCEELTRKAADLSWENENLKREKELALKEYQALETTNKHLKAQMAKAIKKEAEECPGDLKSTRVELPAIPATNHPLLLYNQHSFSPFCWSSIIQSSNPVQSHHGHQNAIFIPPNFPLPTNGKLESPQQQENPINANGPRAPLYMVSYPWFFPVPDHANGFHPQPSSGLKHVNDETSVHNGCSAIASSTATEFMENHHSSLPVKVKSEVRVINDLNETPVGFPPDGGGQCPETHLQELILTSVALNSVTPAVAVKKEIGFPDGLFAKASPLIGALPEKSRDSVKFPSKKLVDAAAAAEARKRRKELTKLKNIHGRQCRVNNC